MGQRQLKSLRRAERQVGDQSIELTQLQLKQHSGPLPAPSDFAEYEGTLPGAAERIMRMAEQQAANRRECELISVKSDANNTIETRKLERRGQWMCFIICAIILINIPICASFGATGAAAALAGVMATVVLAFTLNRKSQK